MIYRECGGKPIDKTELIEAKMQKDVKIKIKDVKKN